MDHFLSGRYVREVIYMLILNHCSIIDDWCPKPETGSCDGCPLFQLVQQYRVDSHEMQNRGKGEMRCISVSRETEASRSR